MSKQKHDIGRQKRQNRKAREQPERPIDFAKDLVERGLAKSAILQK